MNRFPLQSLRTVTTVFGVGGPSSRFVIGLLVSCSAIAFSTGSQAQGLAVSAPGCTANPGAAVSNTPATGGLAISGASDCPPGTSPSARVNDAGGIAIGNDRANPTITQGGGGSIAIGNGARGGATGATNAVALGTNAQAIATSATALGHASTARAANSVAIGGGNAIGAASIAIGQGAVTNGQDSTAIGNLASATASNSVALGRQSSATRGAQTNYVGYGLAARQNSIGEVAIGTASGTRQLTGVAAGSSATDAVNVAQLTAIDAQSDLLGANIATALGGGAAYNSTTGALSTPSYTIQGTARTGVAAAFTALDTTITSLTNGTAGLVRQPTTSSGVTIAAATGGTTVGFAGTGGARRLTGVAAGAVSSASTEAVNGGQLFATAQSLATGLGGGATVAANGTVTTPIYRIQGSNRTGVAAALTALDTQTTANTTSIAGLTTAVNSGSAGLVRQSGSTAGLTVGAATGGTTVNFTGTSGARRLTGVATGTVSAASSEAINGAQLHASNTSIANALGGGSTVAANGTVTAPAYRIQGATRTSVGAALTALDTQLTTNTANISALSQAVSSGTIGLVRQTSPDAALTVGASSGGDTVDLTGTAGARRLTGLGAGAVSAGSSDAVNGSQLAATNSAVQAVTDTVAAQAARGFTSNAADAVAPVASGDGSAAGGSGAAASGDQATAVGVDSTAAGDQATAIGSAATASGTNSVAIGANSDDEGEANVVSVGSASAGRRITNVSMGMNQTDAVNVGQLNSAMSQTLASANAYTDARFAGLSFDLNEARRDSEGATAASMALAGIPQSFERGMGMFGMGVGTWQGESAVAFGISKAADSGLVVFKAGATYNSRGQGGANGGLGFAF